MRLVPRIVKPSGKDAADVRGAGSNKVAKWEKRAAETSGRLIRWGERSQMDRNRRP